MDTGLTQKFGGCALLVCLLAALAGCDDTREQARSLPTVRYAEVATQRLTLTTELPGRVSALMVSEVRPQVSGIIQERCFAEGADVEAGQVLYRIDPSLFEAALDKARADLAKAEASETSARLLAERYGQLIKVHAVSQQEHDEAVSAYDHAKAEVQSCREAVRTAAINLGYTRVTAPVSGRIGRSYITPGALVTQNQADPLATIQHLSTVYVDLSQSSTELLALRRALAQGQLRSGGADSAKVRLKLEDGTPYTRSIALSGPEQAEDWIEGDLLFSDVTIDQSTGMVNLRARFENPHNVLLPGMYVRAVLEEGVLDNAVLAPQKAVMRDMRGRPYVYVLETRQDEHGEQTFAVASRPVEIDRNVGNSWLIRSGLDQGDRLLLEGHVKARPGQTVAAVPANADTRLLSAASATETKVR